MSSRQARAIERRVASDQQREYTNARLNAERVKDAKAAQYNRIGERFLTHLIEREKKKATTEHESDLFERRAQLKMLFEQEQEMYLAEIDAQTKRLPELRLQDLRNRVEEMRKQREKDEKEFVHEMLLRQKRNESDTYKTMLSRQIALETTLVQQADAELRELISREEKEKEETIDKSSQGMFREEPKKQKPTHDTTDLEEFKKTRNQEHMKEQKEEDKMMERYEENRLKERQMKEAELERKRAVQKELQESHEQSIAIRKKQKDEEEEYDRQFMQKNQREYEEEQKARAEKQRKILLEADRERKAHEEAKAQLIAQEKLEEEMRTKEQERRYQAQMEQWDKAEQRKRRIVSEATDFNATEIAKRESQQRKGRQETLENTLNAQTQIDALKSERIAQINRNREEQIKYQKMLEQQILEKKLNEKNESQSSRQDETEIALQSDINVKEKRIEELKAKIRTGKKM